MNAEVEIHVGNRQDVLAIPNAALRTQRDMASAAIVLGLDPAQAQQQLAQAREQQRGEGGRATMGGTTARDTGTTAETISFGGREIELPEGVSAE
ncbi:MAG: hypothetical protein GWN99_09435, partial [Gemmatimonadetes bacterium]|nr:hypothetical protein [Gemmatimonadota bacterium]NIS01271.1 hypothetical protein [Gemmatimonadota bacterium]NIT67017.1 hypothetical protein [Gemmatimonadota bacterium]NIU51640.1 hypothetical protein [Gemmatimonadota bacterium]NIV23811.1 hypothetical protein [Gemmatimonadota bacterium]